MATVVLIHGALHGPWCWDGVADNLERLGVSAIAPELPFTGFADDVARARESLENAGPGAVVCGHSYGGMVISEAAEGLSNVVRLVYLAAMQTDIGESVFDVMSRHPSPGSPPTARVVDGKFEYDLGELREFFYADSDPAVVAEIAPLLRPMLQENWVLRREPAWRQMPSTYVVCAHDRVVAPELQREMATRAQVVVEWESDHSAFLTRPAELAHLLATYIQR